MYMRTLFGSKGSAEVELVGGQLESIPARVNAKGLLQNVEVSAYSYFDPFIYQSVTIS